MKSIETKMNKISTKTAKTHYLPYIYTYVCSLKKQKNHVTFMSFYKNILRREIPNWNGSSFCAFLKWTLPLLKTPRRLLPKGFYPFANPTKGSALSKPAPRSVGQGLPILVALFLVSPRALITRIYIQIIV